MCETGVVTRPPSLGGRERAESEGMKTSALHIMEYYRVMTDGPWRTISTLRRLESDAHSGETGLWVWDSGLFPC